MSIICWMKIREPWRTSKWAFKLRLFLSVSFRSTQSRKRKILKSVSNSHLDRSVPFVLGWMVGSGLWSGPFDHWLLYILWYGHFGILCFLQPGPLLSRAFFPPAHLEQENRDVK